MVCWIRLRRESRLHQSSSACRAAFSCSFVSRSAFTCSRAACTSPFVASSRCCAVAATASAAKRRSSWAMSFPCTALRKVDAAAAACKKSPSLSRFCVCTVDCPSRALALPAPPCWPPPTAAKPWLPPPHLQRGVPLEKCAYRALLSERSTPQQPPTPRGEFAVFEVFD